MGFNLRSSAAAVAASFTLLTTPSSTTAQPRPHSPAEVQAATSWWQQRDALPAQANLTGLSIKTVNQPRNLFETVNTLCVLSTGLVTRLGDGIIFDTGSVYRVALNESRLCIVTPELRITPRAASTARELVGYLSELNPLAGAYLRSEPVIPGLPAMPIEGSPAQGIRIPFDVMAGIIMAHELRQAGLVKPPAPAAQTLPDNWTEQPGLLPAGPQSALISSRLPDGSCGLRVGNAPAVPLPPASIAIPDTTRAVFMDAQCRVQPLVTIPVESAAVTTTSNPPGRLGIPQPGSGTPATPAGGKVAAVPLTAAMVTYGLALLGPPLQQAWRSVQGVIVNNSPEAGQLLQNKQASGMSDTEVGRRAIPLANETPDEKRQRCYEEWETAEQMCRRNLGGGISGGYKSIEDCKRGLVSEACKGNKIDWGPKGPPPGWVP